MTFEELQARQRETQERMQAAEARAAQQEEARPTFAERASQQFNTGLVNFAATATAGAAVPLAGALRWAASPLTGENLSLQEQIQGRRQALQNMNQQAGWAAPLIGDVAGAFAPGGIPAQMGRAGMKVAGAVTSRAAPGVGARMAGQGGAAVGEGLIYDANLGRLDLTTEEGQREARASAAFRAIAGAGGQGIADGGAAFMNWLLGGRNASNVAEALTSAEGSRTGGLSPRDLAGISMPEGRGYMDALERADDPVAMARRVAPYVVSSPAPKEGAGQMLDDALEATQSYRARVERQVFDNVDSVATMASPGERLSRLNQALAGPRQIYSDMLRMDGKNIVTQDAVRNNLIRAFGGDPRRTNIKTLMRNLSRQDLPAFRSLHNDIRRMAGQDGRLRVRQLITLKKTVDQMLNPMYRRANDQPLTPAAIGQLRAFQKRLTNQIDSNVRVDYRALNRQFAGEYATEEAFEVGQKAFSNKLSLGEIQDWLNSTDSPQLRDAFREGFSDGLATSVQQRGYIGALRSVFGDAGDSTRVKVGNIEKMRSALGPDLTDALLEVATITGPRVEAAQIMEDAIRVKRNNPNSTDPEVLKEFALAGGGFFGHSSRARGVEAASNIRTRPTPRTGEDILRILGTTGDNYNRAIQRFYGVHSRDWSPTVGAQLGAIGHDPTPDDPGPVGNMFMDINDRFGLN